MPPYRWKCYVCGETNAANTESCSTCGFKAIATGANPRRIGRALTRNTLFRFGSAVARKVVQTLKPCSNTAEMGMKVNGSCHCGAIRFTADVDESRVMVCHCTDCQTLTGSAFRVVVPAETEALRLEGAPKIYVKTAQSGARRVQAFCPDCGTPLYSAAAPDATRVFLRIGAIRERAALRPSLQIWRRSALGWLDGLSSVPASPEQQALDAR